MALSFAEALGNFETKKFPVVKEVKKMPTEEEVVNFVPDETNDADTNLKKNDLDHNNTTFVGQGEAGNGTHENSHEEQDLPHIDNLTLDEDTSCVTESANQKKSPVSFPTDGITVRSNYTVPQPFALATEKRASGGNHAFVVDVAGNGDKHAVADNHLSPITLKKAQIHSPLTSMKPLQPDNTMYPEDDGSFSVSSSTAPSIRISKSRTTVASAPTFRSSERAEKRKEFYSKLDEKHQAMEAERMQNESRAKEEQEAALRKLRKNLVFKANPMPSFYHEGPPPKAEIKKVPPTRAKSPKLGRRKSCSDADADEDNNHAFGRQLRYSLGACKGTPGKLHNSPKIGSAAKVKEAPKSTKAIPKASAVEASNDATAGVTV